MLRDTGGSEGVSRLLFNSSRENVGPRCLEIPEGNGRKHRGEVGVEYIAR